VVVGAVDALVEQGLFAVAKAHFSEGENLINSTMRARLDFTLRHRRRNPKTRVFSPKTRIKCPMLQKVQKVTLLYRKIAKCNYVCKAFKIKGLENAFRAYLWLARSEARCALIRKIHLTTEFRRVSQRNWPES
jgi:hypothetical protein